LKPVSWIADRGYYRRMAMSLVCGPGARSELSPAAALFRSLADPVRLVILLRLSEGEARVVDLTEVLGLAQSTVSKHLACLRGCGLVDFRAEGRQSFYFVSRPELLDLLRSAENLLAATGEAVALCPRYGSAAVVAERGV
jgi:ArsR family transcriptional regulator, cadmium/lead-responsive transcriptional repressor